MTSDKEIRYVINTNPYSRMRVLSPNSQETHLVDCARQMMIVPHPIRAPYWSHQQLRIAEALWHSVSVKSRCPQNMHMMNTPMRAAVVKWGSRKFRSLMRLSLNQVWVRCSWRRDDSNYSHTHVKTNRCCCSSLSQHCFHKPPSVIIALNIPWR